MNIKEQVKDLWRICFNDTEDFIDMYFRLRYKEEKSLYIQKDNMVISALQLIPYPMTFCSTTIQTSYISGACTHPDYRKKGAMHKLLIQAFVRMYSEGILISTLIPEQPRLVDYYSCMGYVSVFNYSKRVLNWKFAEISETDENIRIERDVKYQDDIYDYFNRKMSERLCCIQHTKADFGVILAELSLSKGNLFLAVREEERKIEGIAFMIAKKEIGYINELFAESQEIENKLLRQAAIQCKCNQLAIISPPGNMSEPFPLGMARIIDANGVLNLFAATHPEIEMNIELHDATLSANNGYYYLRNGKCITSENKLTKVHKQLSIGELTEMVLSEMQPYMSLMIN
jgi:predicted acetyltransferase